MLAGVFHLHEQEARQVMTPIPAVVTVDVSEDVETALRRCVSSGHTRLVVDRGREPGPRPRHRPRQLAGARLMAEGPSASIEALVKPALIVPETKPLDDLLADLQRERSSMAVVVDEYGRVAGIVTVEDIVEEVVGEIDDETDPAGGEVRRLANGDWFVRGHVALTDLLDYGLELPLDTDAYNSVGGFVFAELGPAAQARRHGARGRLLDPRRVGAREPHRGGPHPPPRDAAGPAIPDLEAVGVAGAPGPRTRSGPLSGPDCAAGRRCTCEIRSHAQYRRGVSTPSKGCAEREEPVNRGVLSALRPAAAAAGAGKERGRPAWGRRGPAGCPSQEGHTRRRNVCLVLNCEQDRARTSRSPQRPVRSRLRLGRGETATLRRAAARRRAGSRPPGEAGSRPRAGARGGCGGRRSSSPGSGAISPYLRNGKAQTSSTPSVSPSRKSRLGQQRVEVAQPARHVSAPGGDPRGVGRRRGRARRRSRSARDFQTSLNHSTATSAAARARRLGRPQRGLGHVLLEPGEDRRRVRDDLARAVSSTGTSSWPLSASTAERSAAVDVDPFDARRPCGPPRARRARRSWRTRSGGRGSRPPELIAARVGRPRRSSLTPRPPRCGASVVVEAAAALAAERALLDELR